MAVGGVLAKAHFAVVRMTCMAHEGLADVLTEGQNQTDRLVDAGFNFVRGFDVFNMLLDVAVVTAVAHACQRKVEGQTPPAERAEEGQAGPAISAGHGDNIGSVVNCRLVLPLLSQRCFKPHSQALCPCNLLVFAHLVPVLFY